MVRGKHRTSSIARFHGVVCQSKSLLGQREETLETLIMSRSN
jgi:hypothetical protein